MIIEELEFAVAPSTEAKWGLAGIGAGILVAGGYLLLAAAFTS
jgi:hypothetical protein